MISGCVQIEDSMTHTGFLGFVPDLRCAGFSGTPRPASFDSRGGKKTICGVCGTSHRSFYDHKLRLVRDLSCGDTRVFLEVEVRRVWCQSCGKVKQEKLSWLAENPFYTKRFAFFVGRRCRAATIRDVARELHLDWKTVKELDKQYMQEQLRRVGTAGARIIGLDEVSIRKGHSHRIVVSDLVRQRPIWSGGRDRSEESMDQFYQWLGAKKSRRIELAVMDMWKPFRMSTSRHAPQAKILFDKFHVMRRPTLAEEAAPGQQAAQHGLRAEGIFRSAMGLREGRLGPAIHGELGSRFEVASAPLRPYEDFALIIVRHWDGIAAYCELDNKVSLGFVEGLNNKIRVLQRRAYGLRDEEYLRLKILGCMLPEI